MTGVSECAARGVGAKTHAQFRHRVTLTLPGEKVRYDVMDFELDAGQRAWLTEVREFLHDNVTEELKAELAAHDLEFPDGEVARFRRKIGAKGWFGLNWPREYGGLGAKGASAPRTCIC